MGPLEDRLTPAFGPTGLLSPTAAGTDAVAEVGAGSRLAGVNTGESALLNGLLGSLAGAGAGVALNVADYNTLAGGDVNFGAVLDSLRSQLALANPGQALTADITLNQLLTAATAAAQADGNAALAAPLAAARTALGPAAGTFCLGDLFHVSLSADAYAQAGVNALDLLVGGVQLLNCRSVVVTPSSFAVTGAALGLGSVLNGVDVEARVAEPPVFAVGPAGTTFSSAAVRLKLNLDLVDVALDTSGLTTALGGAFGPAVTATAAARLGRVQLYADVAGGSGAIQAIDAVTRAVTVRSTPSVANVYIGTVADAVFYNTGRAINPATDLTAATVGALDINVSSILLGSLANVGTGLAVKAAAVGAAATAATNEFDGPLPQSATVGAGAAAAANLLGTLVSDLRLSLTGSLGALLDPLVGGLILPVLQPLTTNLLAPTLGTVLGGVADPALAALGVGIGEMDVAVLGADLPDLLPTVSVGNAVVSEGDGGTTATFTVTLSAAAAQTVTVDYMTDEGTAAAGTDYVPTSGTLTFQPGQTTQTVTVNIAGDRTVEADEAFALILRNPSHATLGVAVGTGTIVNDDAAGLAVVQTGGRTAVTEGGAGDTVTVSLTSQPAAAVTVTLATGSRVTAGPTVLTFTPADWDVPQTVTVTAVSNGVYSGPRTDAVAFLVASADPNYAARVVPPVPVAVTDDEAMPAVSVGTTTAVEGGTAAVALTLSRPSESDVTVFVSTVDGSATAGTDYWPVVIRPVTIPAGRLTATLDIGLIGNGLFDTAKAFSVVLFAPVGGTLGTTTGTVSVTDADPAPTLSIAGAVVNEAAGTVTLTVTRSGATALPASVSYATAAAAGLPDYAATSGALSFPPSLGDVTRTVTVPLVNDAVYEGTEQFFVNLSNAFGATVTAGQAAVTVTDDDARPSLSVGNAVVNAGSVTFTVTLTGATALPTAVAYATADGTAVATGPGADYVATSGVLSFAPSAGGPQTLTVTVPLVAGGTRATAEAFTLALSGPTNATLGTATAAVTLPAVRPVPTVSVGNASVTEGTGGPAALAFTVSLSAAGTQVVTVRYATADGTATAGADYAATSGTLTFLPGETSKTVLVSILGDNLDEPAEALTLSLSGPTNATLGTATGTGTSVDDDQPPAVSVANTSVTEGNGGTTAMTYTVTLSAASGRTVTVNYAAAGTATTGTLTFAPGETTKTVTVVVRGDALDEADGTVTLRLSDSVNATLGTAVGTGTVVDDDPPPTVTVAAATAVEGTVATFTVTLSAPSGRTVTVDYATADGTAHAGSRYTATTGTLTFAPGETVKTVTVSLADDAAATANQTFRLVLGSPTNALLGAAGTGTGTIVSNDVPTGGADSFPASEGTPLVVAAPGVLANDVTGTPGRVELVAGPSHGTLSLSPDGGFTYTPAANYHGPDGFTYRAVNANGPSLPVTVALSVAATVTPVITTGPDVTAPYAGGPQAVPGWVTGLPAGAGPVLTIRVTADNPALFAVPPSIDPATGTLTYTPADAASGSTAVHVVVRDAGGVVVRDTTFQITVEGPTRVNQNQFALVAVGSEPGRDDGVTVYTPDGQVAFVVPGSGHPGGTRAAVGDLDGDGTADVVTVGGPGRPAVLSFVNGATGQTMRSIAPFESSFSGGAFVAAADVNGDGAADVAVSADVTGGPRVRLFDGKTGDVLCDFFGIDDPAFRGGARVAFGDVNGDGVDDLIVAAGTGGGPRVAVWDGATLRPGGTPTRLMPDFFAFEPSLRNGVFVTAGDVNGDGKADLILGGGPSGAPRVLILDAAALAEGRQATGALANFFAGDPDLRTGARVAAKDVDGDNLADVVVGTPDPSGAVVRTYLGKDIRAGVLPAANASFEPFADDFAGVYVG